MSEHLPDVELTERQQERAVPIRLSLTSWVNCDKAARWIVYLLDQDAATTGQAAGLERKVQQLESDLAWIRRRTGFWGEVPQVYGDTTGTYAEKDAQPSRPGRIMTLRECMEAEDGFPCQQMEASTAPLTHQEIFSAVHHWATEIVRVTAAVPTQCTTETTGDRNGR